MTDLHIMIILIEGEYPRESRNTPSKMKILLLKEFEVNVPEKDILFEYGIVEDYENESKKIEDGHY